MLLNERVVLCAWNTEFCHTSLAKLIVSASVIYGEHLLSFWESEISVREVPIKKKVWVLSKRPWAETLCMCLMVGGRSLLCETPP